MLCLSLDSADWARFWAQFAEQFWPNLAATLIGAYLGFRWAFAGDHAREQRARGAQEVALLRAAQRAVEDNVKLCAPLKATIQGQQLPSVEMDVVLLDATLPRLAELSVATDLLGELSRFCYALHMVNRKLDHFLAVSRLLDIPDAQAQVGQPILINLAYVEGSGNRLLPPLFTARLAVLEAPPRRPWWKFWGG